MAATDWPEKMTDMEAVERLQAIMISACEGNQDLSNGREYKALRTPLIRRADLSDVVPTYIRSNRDLTSFWAYIRKVSEKWQPRREHVWESFKPLFDRAEGRTQAPISSARWTGRSRKARTPAQQAKVVLSLAPDALLGVEMLLEESERANHNGGPIEPEKLAAIEKLRELRDALGKLIDLAEGGQPLEEQLGVLARMKSGIFRWSAETLSLTIAELPLVASTSVIGCGVMGLLNVIVPSEQAATMGAAVAAAQVAGVIHSRSQKAKTT